MVYPFCWKNTASDFLYVPCCLHFWQMIRIATQKPPFDWPQTKVGLNMFAVWIVSQKTSWRPTKKKVFPLSLYFGIIICFCVANSFFPPSLLQIIYIDFAFKGTFCNLLYFSMLRCRNVKKYGGTNSKGWTESVPPPELPKKLSC